MDNRHGLVVDACVVHATGTGECAAASGLLAALPPGEWHGWRRQGPRHP